MPILPPKCFSLMCFEIMVFLGILFLIMAPNFHLNSGLHFVLLFTPSQDSLLPIINNLMSKSNVLTLLLNNTFVVIVLHLKVNGVSICHCEMAYNSSYHKSIGMSQFRANYGFDPICNIDSPPILLKDNASMLTRDWSSHLCT